MFCTHMPESWNDAYLGIEKIDQINLDFLIGCITGFVQDYDIFLVNALKCLESCTKPQLWRIKHTADNLLCLVALLATGR